MFRQTLIKLTLLYLGIMMVISLFFSVILYRSSLLGLDRDFGRQTDLLQRRLPSLGGIGQYLDDRRDQVNDEKIRLFGQLVVTNVIILGLGGLASYVLARRTLKPIEAAHQAQMRFSADASHELRTPLAVMQTEIEVTLMDPKLSLTAAKSQLRSNLDELARLTSLSEGLLNIARSEHEGMPEKPVVLAVTLQLAIDNNKKMADKKDISLYLEKIADNMIVMGDENSLVQCFNIILNNAVKYCPEKSVVRISAQGDNRRITVIVSDDGPGISEAALPHLFERFYRADSSRTSSGDVQGYGLGLAIAENIVKIHRGDITAKSTPGKGATFTVHLPI